jgi:4-diphosphocytidyl-2-C-methyl-D-erythritol kinase
LTPLRLLAPAKLNVSLRVTGRRPNGHHELDSVFVLLDLADRLLLLPGCSGIRVEGEDVAGLPIGETNLAWRGLVAGLGGPPDLVCLALEKRIPVEAGLGGGSSDAAAAWRLGRAWRGARESPSAEKLDELSAIGADVPFFAAATAAARVTGIGERVEPIPAPERHVVLVHPPFGLSTGAVFAELRRDEWGRLDNDLLAPARRLRPEVDDLLEAVTAAGGEPRLTGSGPTLYSLSDDLERASAVAERLSAAGTRVTLTRTRTEPTAIEPIDVEEDT